MILSIIKAKMKNAGRMIVGWDQSPDCCASGKVVLLVASEPDVDTTYLVLPSVDVQEQTSLLG